jgi:hypothetical protein
MSQAVALDLPDGVEPMCSTPSVGGYAKVVAHLKALDAKYRACSGSTCPKTYASTLSTPGPS